MGAPVFPWALSACGVYFQSEFLAEKISLIADVLRRHALPVASSAKPSASRE
jgi:hypothetical protein